MDYFVHYYNEIFKPYFKNCGFSKHRNLYYRVKNDLVQGFTFQRIGGFTCTIDIGLVPLCEKINIINVPFSSELRIGDLINGRDEWWYYENNPVDIGRILDEMFQACSTHMMNLFNKVIDCRKYYDFRLEFDHKRWSGIDCPKDKLVLYDFLLCIKIGLYDEAVYHIDRLNELNEKNVAANIKDWEEEVKFGLEPKSKEFIEGYLEEWEKNRKVLVDLKQRLIANDMKYINNLISENESYTLDSISKLNKKKTVMIP